MNVAKNSSMLKLKFPVLNEVEYIDLVKDRVNVLTIDGKDVENFSWRQLQLYAGERLNPGVYGYTLKFNGNNEIFRGSLKVVSLNKKGLKEMESPEIIAVKKSVDEISKRLNNLKTDSPGMDLIMSLTKQSYESQLSFLRDEITRKEKSIERLERDIDKLNEQLDAAESIIDDLKSKTGLNQYIGIAKEFLMMKAGNSKPISNLKDSDSTDIPAEILQVLGVVDWSKIDANVLNEIIHYLKIFIQKLPLKGV